MAVDAPPFVWAFVDNEAGRALRYGEPETDNIGLGLDCAEGRLAFSVWATSSPRGMSKASFPTRLRLRAGRRAFDLPAMGHVTETGGGEAIVTATLDRPVAVLEALRAARRLTIETIDGRGHSPAPSWPQLARLAAACAIDL